MRRLAQLREKKQGFTLIELVMVIVIVGVLAAIIVPNYVDYVGKSGASTTKANLQMIRTAIQTFRSENAGAYPTNLATDLVPTYLPEIPPDGLLQQNGVVTAVDNAGGWQYVSGTGVIKPNLTGADAYGVNFSAY